MPDLNIREAAGVEEEYAGHVQLYTDNRVIIISEPDLPVPANRAEYDYEKISSDPEEVFKLYPEIFRCVACNACSKVCPMDVEVMDVISAVKRGDLELAKELSFDCIQCGICASRCMGELPQYHISQLARRIVGGKITVKSEHLAKMVEQIEKSRYKENLEKLTKLTEDELKGLYQKREMEPATGDEYWKPKDEAYL